MRKNHLTGHPALIIPALAIAILSNEPPSAARCSSPIVVMIDAARVELEMTLVASRAPPNPAYLKNSKIDSLGKRYAQLFFYRNLFQKVEIVTKIYLRLKYISNNLVYH